jgi:hypothetical protein
MVNTPNLQAPYIEAGQAQKHVTHNESLRIIDNVLYIVVPNLNTNTPPASPAEGTRHIVGSAPTGLFVGQAGKLAAFSDSAWHFHTIRIGWTVFNTSDQKLYIWIGSWLAVGASGAGGSGPTNISISDKTANTFQLNSDTGGDVIVPSATITEAGLMTATDKVKLDALPTETTLNSSLATKQNNILFREEFTDLGVAGDVTTIRFVGDSTTATLAGSVLTVTSTGITQALADSRYINAAGDTMTGTLSGPTIRTTGATNAISVEARDVPGLFSFFFKSGGFTRFAAGSTPLLVMADDGSSQTFWDGTAFRQIYHAGNLAAAVANKVGTWTGTGLPPIGFQITFTSTVAVPTGTLNGANFVNSGAGPLWNVRYQTGGNLYAGSTWAVTNGFTDTANSRSIYTAVRLT